MKNILTLFIVSMFILSGCSKESEDTDADVVQDISKGTVLGNENMYSEVLSRNMNYSVYLPPGYSTNEDEYPVLYLLHGMWGNYRDWVTNGMSSVVDYQINQQEAKEMIVIMPDGLDAFYCNNYNGGDMRYEDFFIDEFIPQIETNYRIKTEGNNRAIAGLSMGGYGATFHAYKRPEMFSSCYSMSGALNMGNAAPDIKEILNAYSEDQLEKLPAYTLECGTEDMLVFSANESFDAFLNEKQIEHTYIKRTGTHDWDFWMACLPKALQFVSQNFD